MGFIERTDTYQVPRNTGIAGLVKTVVLILSEIPKVKEIRIQNNGSISYTWYLPEDAPEKSLAVELESLTPFTIIRNALVSEVKGATPQTAIAKMFAQMQAEHLYPICFVTGAATQLWDWHKAVTGMELPESDSFYGLPLVHDRGIPDDVLILCTCFARTQSISDTYKSYKYQLEMPNAERGIEDDHQVGTGGAGHSSGVPQVGSPNPVRADGGDHRAQPDPVGDRGSDAERRLYQGQGDRPGSSSAVPAYAAPWGAALPRSR